jgi:hypothetical protein
VILNGVDYLATVLGAGGTISATVSSDNSDTMLIVK